MEERETIHDLAGEVERLKQELEEMRGRKDAAYTERDHVVALMTRLASACGWKVGLRDHEGEDWGPKWKRVVYIESPNAQLSWHFHEEQAPLFEALGAYDKPWDGHTTEQKYEKIRKLVAEIDRLSRSLFRQPT